MYFREIQAKTNMKTKQNKNITGLCECVLDRKILKLLNVHRRSFVIIRQLVIKKKKETTAVIRAQMCIRGEERER